MVSNAFSRSISIIPVKRPLSNPFKILSFKLERHKSVECFVLKRDRYLYKMFIGLDSLSFGHAQFYRISLKSKVVAKLEGSILAPFLNIGFNFASLQGLGKIFDFMERLHISVTRFAKMTAQSFKNLAGRLSTPAALEILIFFNGFRKISSVVGFNCNLVVMFKFL